MRQKQAANLTLLFDGSSACSLSSLWLGFFLERTAEGRFRLPDDGGLVGLEREESLSWIFMCLWLKKKKKGLQNFSVFKTNKLHFTAYSLYRNLKSTSASAVTSYLE